MGKALGAQKDIASQHLPCMLWFLWLVDPECICCYSMRKDTIVQIPAQDGKLTLNCINKRKHFYTGYSLKVL